MSGRKGRLWLSLRGAVRDHLMASRADQERAPRLLQELLALSPAERLAAVAADSAFRSLGLARCLVDRADEVCETNPSEAEHLAALALEVAGRLTPVRDGFAREALLGEAHCREAEAWRVRGDLPRAAAALALAFERLEALPLDTPERAEYSFRLARLRRDQGYEDEAHALMAQAADRFDALPDLRRAAECRLELGWMRLEAIEPAAALVLFERVRDEADIHPPDPARWLSLRHGLALAYADLRRPAKAWEVIAEVAGAASQWRRPDRLRAQRVEASVAQRLEAGDEAAQILSETWPALVEEGAPYEALEALAQMAETLAERERWDEVACLKESLGAFAGLPAPIREAMKLALDRATRPGAAEGGLFEDLQRWLRRARYDPEARFSNPKPGEAAS
jgi:hypothetical protein